VVGNSAFHPSVESDQNKAASTRWTLLPRCLANAASPVYVICTWAGAGWHEVKVWAGELESNQQWFTKEYKQCTAHFTPLFDSSVAVFLYINIET
jgi:hypothetical protein